ncbi:hypothetical protein ACFLZA_01005 [Candidatus Neomarinimicrobiota bacterium]
MKKYGILIIALFIFTSCTTVSVIPIGTSNSGIYKNKIPVYTSRSTFDSEFEEIALITAKFDAEFGVMDDDGAMEKIFKEAYIIGADGLIFKGSDSNSLWFTAIKFK